MECPRRALNECLRKPRQTAHAEPRVGLLLSPACPLPALDALRVGEAAPCGGRSGLCPAVLCCGAAAKCPSAHISVSSGNISVEKFMGWDCLRRGTHISGVSPEGAGAAVGVGAPRGTGRRHCSPAVSSAWSTRVLGAAHCWSEWVCKPCQPSPCYSHPLIQGACVSGSSQDRVLPASLRLTATPDALPSSALSAASRRTVCVVPSV